MLAFQAFHRRSHVDGEACHFLLGAGRHVDFTNLLALPHFVVPRAVHPDVHLERFRGARNNEQVESRLVALLRAFERLQSQLVLLQTFKAKILITNNVTVLHPCNRRVVVPHVPSILLHLCVGQIASDTGRIILVWVKTEHMETFRSHFGTLVFMSLAVFHRAHFAFRIRVETLHHHGAAFFHRLLVPRHVDRCHHGLAGKAEITWRTMVEHIPLAVDFLNAAVGVVPSVGRLDSRALTVQFRSAGIHQHAADFPRAERSVSISITQRGVAAAHSIVGA